MEINEEIVSYIINNTSVTHLVYTNNINEIEQKCSIKPYFVCQFHFEKTPSMRTSINKNFFNCFGCGTHGNQIDYLMEYENITYEQAVYLLAEIYLIELPNNPYKNETELVNKYRNVLISNEYLEFLMNSYNKKGNKNLENKKVYENMFFQIERIKKGEYDYNINQDKVLIIKNCI